MKVLNYDKSYVPPPTYHGNGFVIVMISLLFDGYAGGHLIKTPGGSVVRWRDRAADPTVERGLKMPLTCPHSDLPHGKEAHHHRHLTTGALRRGRWQELARGVFRTPACPLQTLHKSTVIKNVPGERDLSFSVFPGPLVVNHCLLGIKVTYLRADKSERSLS